MIAIAAGIGALVLTSAQTAASPDPAKRNAAWQVGPLASGLCLLVGEYPDGTRLFIGSGGVGPANLSLANPRWQATTGRFYPMALVLDGRRTELSAVGMVEGGLSGFMFRVGTDFLGDLAAARRLELSGTAAPRQSLDLAGSAAAVARLRECLAERKGTFRPPPPPPPPPPPRRQGKERRASPAVPLHRLMSNADYPAAALRAGEQGTVRFRLDVAANGRVTACTISGSSGSASLDSTTCRLMTMRARFEPARDRLGRPVADSFESRIAWRIEQPPPDPEPPPSP